MTEKKKLHEEADKNGRKKESKADTTSRLEGKQKDEIWSMETKKREKWKVIGNLERVEERRKEVEKL